jgi:superfamily II DNA or RNA helicase
MNVVSTSAIIDQLTLRPRPNPFNKYTQAVYCARPVSGTTNVQVPRFWARSMGFTPIAIDGFPMASCDFRGTLKSRVDDPPRPQKECVDAVISEFSKPGIRGGVVVLPCGYGKTVVAIACAVKHRQKTLVVVGKKFLMDQWTKSIGDFVPLARIGYMWQSRLQVNDCDFVVCMLHSLALGKYTDVMSHFGLVIWDECHHLAAESFNSAVRQVSARCSLGLSATPERSDGLDKLLAWSLGDVIFREVRPSEMLTVNVIKYVGTSVMRLGRDGKPMRAKMLSELTAEPARNRMLAQMIGKLYHENRCIICFSDRIDQLRHVRQWLHQLGCVPDAEVADYVGTTKPMDRVMAATKRVLLSTYAMGREGLDIPHLDTCVMMSPVSQVEQVVGRIQRPGECKQPLVVIDVDDGYAPYQGSLSKRVRFYKISGFSIANGPFGSFMKASIAG